MKVRRKNNHRLIIIENNLRTIKDQKPLAYSAFDQELTFWRDEQGVIRCSEDRCPHRNARLSEGSLEEN